MESIFNVYFLCGKIYVFVVFMFGRIDFLRVTAFCKKVLFELLLSMKNERYMYIDRALAYI
jgi:hypothetical protein